MRDNAIELPIAGGMVSRLTVDFAFTLLLEDRGSLVLETEFVFTEESGVEATLDPESDRTLLAPALRLFGQVVEKAVASSSGSLDIRFQNGSELTVQPHPRFEAWTLTTPSGMWIATPGGGLGSWGSTIREPGSI